MNRRKRVIFTALGGLTILAVAFVALPALFPQLGLLKIITDGHENAKVKAQDSAPAPTDTKPKCYYLEGGGVRSVWSDGAELIQLPGEITIDIEAPLQRSTRSAVTAYQDGTVRLQTFQIGTLTEDISNREPLKTRWFKPDGSSMPVPQPGAYPEVWPQVSKFFAADHPWDSPDREWTEIRPPHDPTDPDIFGPVETERRSGNIRFTEFADGTTRIDHPDLEDNSAVYRNGSRYIYRWDDPSMGVPVEFQYRDNEDSGGLPVCDKRGPTNLVKFDDGVERHLVYPPGTDAMDMEDTQPVCDKFVDSQGNEFTPEDPSKYPVRSISDDIRQALREMS